ncbi:hypothetical protein [Halorubellus litoreus]|uniref:Lipoprotein n=1 Tax=Halorubellus litoreus TaxID=755308 RepID=A0ABD5VDH1_9EURY
MRRRTVVASAFGGVGLASCSSFAEREPPVGLGRIRLVNATDDVIEVVVTVEREGRRVHEDAFELEYRGVREVVDETMGHRVPYAVTVSVPGDSRAGTTSWERLDSLVSNWGDMTCYELSFTVDTDEITTAFNADGVECPS